MKRPANQFNCFSPPVMLATLVIEGVLVLYTLFRYKLNMLSKLVVITLTALGTFQLAEYFVCTGQGSAYAEAWSRVGFVAITMLPPLGIHILHVLAGKPARKMVALGYATMASFIAFFTFSSSAFAGHQCTGNYVIFQLSDHVTFTYSAYYYGWLLTGLGLGAHWANQFMKQGEKALTKLQTVRALMVGWLIFLVPTALANTIRPETRRGIPSILCGFAVLFALILVLYILPRAARLRSAKA